MSGKTRIILVVVFVIALLALGMGGTIVLAQGPTSTPTPGATSTPGATTTPSSNTKTLAQLYWEALAQRLGITVDKLQQAATDASKDAINQGVKQGLLTQNQADQLLQRLQNTPPGTILGGLGKRGVGANPQRDAMTAISNAGLDAAAKALGMSTNDLTTALQSGKTLLNLANDKKVDVTTLRTAIADAEKVAVDQAVKNGQLTQTQADAIKARLTPDNIDLNRRSFGIQMLGPMQNMMPGGMNGMGKGMGRFGRR